MICFFIAVLQVFGSVQASSAFNDNVSRKLGSEFHVQYEEEVDCSLSASQVAEVARFQPDLTNEYHLFTRENPSVSQPLVYQHSELLRQSHFDSRRRTVVLIHGWIANVTAPSNVVMLPAFLEAGDFNIIVVDWGLGAFTEYKVAALNAIASGRSVARFLNWLIPESGASADQFHITGYSLGGQQAGIVGRNVNGDIDYITSLDPASDCWDEHKIRPTDATYTEIIHTNVFGLGYLEPLGHADFYPNGGALMPGCRVQDSCSHDRAYFYFAESLMGGIFTGIRCATVDEALVGSCSLSETLIMGGITPKSGSKGIYYLDTNASPPFARG